MAKKILLIDDEQELVEMLSFRLQAAGFDMVEAYNGADGVALAKSERPNAILLDLMMPKMDGFEVAEELRACEETKDIPIIVFTAAVGKDLAQKVLGMGATDYVTKPFEPGELIEKVKKALIKRGS